MSHSFVLNAALEALIQENDPDAKNARLVIEYGSRLKCSGSWSASIEFPWKKRDSFKGATNELGNVQINEDKTENKEIGKLIKKERVGHYRVWKQAEGYLLFHHFWASETTTQTGDNTEVTTYHLFYDPITMKEVAFAEEYLFKKRRYQFFDSTFTLNSTKLDVKYGSVPKRYRKRVFQREKI